MKKINEHSERPYNVVTKHDQYIKGIMSSLQGKNLVLGMSDKQVANLLAFANEKYKDDLIRFVFDIKKENMSDYLLIYLLENSYDMNKMAQYFSQFIPKEKINDLVSKSRIKVSKIEENIRKSIRKILSEIYK